MKVYRSISWGWRNLSLIKLISYESSAQKLAIERCRWMDFRLFFVGTWCLSLISSVIIRLINSPSRQTTSITFPSPKTFIFLLPETIKTREKLLSIKVFSPFVLISVARLQTFFFQNNFFFRFSSQRKFASCFFLVFLVKITHEKFLPSIDSLPASDSGVISRYRYP